MKLKIIRNIQKKLRIRKKELRMRNLVSYGPKEVALISLLNLGENYHKLGDLREAIETYKDAVKIAKKIKRREIQAASYGKLGDVYQSLGDFRKAIECHEKALQIAEKLNYEEGIRNCYYSLGNAYHGLGDFRKSIEFHEKALEIAEATKDELAKAVCCTGLGVVYHTVGDVKREIEFLERALEISKEIGYINPPAYSNLGNAYHDLGDFRKAIRFQQKALRRAREIGNRMGEATCYGGLGDAYYGLGDFRKAAKLYEKSLEIAKEIRDKSGEAIRYESLGNAYYSLGDFGEAIKLYEKSLEIAKEIGNINLERLSNLNLSRIYGDDLDEPNLAYDHCEHSIKLFELISGRLVGEEHKIGFFARTSDPYQYMVPLCLKLKREKEALNFTERGKSRAFLRLLAATEIKPSVKLTSKLRSLLNDEETYLAKLREIQTRHLRQKEASVEPGEAERIFEGLNNIYSKIERIAPEYAFTRRGESLSLNEIQDMLSLRKKDTILVEYFVTEDRTFIFVVSSKDKELHMETVPVSREKLNRYIFEDYWREVVNYPDFQDIGDTWLSLSSYLIEPISKYLTGSELIYFVPYGSLHYLPMHALELSGEPLIKQHAVAYSPSASVIRFCQNKGSGKLKSCVSFGVVFEEEAKDVSELFNTSPYNGYSATKDKAIKNCTDKDVIHFSCHGYFDDLDPLSSGVKLYDEVLTAREIFRMRLNAELVTLSACETGLNQGSPGDELIGLTRAFLYAGASSVIVSLWSVDARSTQELMLEFYKLLKKGVDKATALQEAQKEIMGKRGYRHPYYWAPFVLVGDWE